MTQKIKFKEMLSHKKAGILIPLFCIYSKKSFGIADFQDLKLLIDWVKLTGHSILQLLPMNEMGPVFCPYDALSSFALEPVYISLRDLPMPKDKSLKRQIDNLKKNFPLDNGNCDYTVKEEKLRILKEVFLMQGQEEPQGLLRFREENDYWLYGFSLFKALKIRYNGLPWYDWPKEYKERDRESLENFRRDNIEEVRFQEWVQWQLFEQFKDAKEYAGEKGICLKGDLPILVSRDSSDVWEHPEFFKLGLAAGAPPDMYCALGQRWGMPTYDWGKIEESGYAYLKEKLKYAGNFYDILRIDHVVGLFRIWSIPYNEPLENKGLNGFFDPGDESLWGPHGRKILQFMIDNCDMFLCAEDLGIIPLICTETLRDLGIPGNDVQRWVKDWNIRHDFLNKEEYRFLAVTMLSTHDTTNWAAWWENEAGTVDEALFIRKCSDHRAIGFERMRERLFNPALSRHGRLRWRDEIDSVDKLLDELSCAGSLPREHLCDFVGLWKDSFHEKEKLWMLLALPGVMREKCTPEAMQAILRFVLGVNSVFCINNIFDWLYPSGIIKKDAYAYRINTPGTVSRANWSLRVPMPLEDLLKHQVTSDIRTMVSASGRK
ncbi:MAG: 4-alpha-glucanotransferase [Candidatus Omnitrophica bacterium]|jgi:4-alpha-glucanotransferase|nr:4-alpha-glucanotransferase [Candidatus Omnitrophota bacterium]MDD4981198.1 4-alpha-glucanotransferase [Candidatus Omnitrophota bacterium]